MVKKFTKKRGSIQGKTGFPRMPPLFTLHKGGQAIMQMILVNVLCYGHMPMRIRPITFPMISTELTIIGFIASFSGWRR